MVSYHIGLQALNSPTTPFSTSGKVLQNYNLFPNQPNFFSIFLFKKYGIYESKLCGLEGKSMGVLGQNYGSYAPLSLRRNFGN